MPKAVLSYIEQKNLEAVRAVQQNLIDSYEKDFSKRINASSIAKVVMI
jgi:hypothetical protein